MGGNNPRVDEFGEVILAACDLFCDLPFVVFGPFEGIPVHLALKEKAAPGAAFVHYFDLPKSPARRLPLSANLFQTSGTVHQTLVNPKMPCCELLRNVHKCPAANAAEHS